MDMRDIKLPRKPVPPQAPPAPLPVATAAPAPVAPRPDTVEPAVPLPEVPLAPSTPVSPPRPRRAWWEPFVPPFLRHHWTSAAFVLGFIVDNLTLNRVDQLFDNLLLAAYVMLAMVSTLYLYASAADKLPARVSAFGRRAAPILMQYAFGSLLSGMLIFYGRAGSWESSWPFLAIIIAAIYGNEVIKDRSSRLLYNLAILFVGLFSYVVLLVPVVTKLMGPWIFVGSGLIALGVMYGFVGILRKVIPHFIALQQRAIVFTLGCVFVGFNFLYFANIIPPIPLSLKELGIYHFVSKFENSAYQVRYEPAPWWQFWVHSNTTFHPRPGDAVYCYAQVFAPHAFATRVVHVWDFKDPELGWTERARISYAVSGGRDEGYRGFSSISNYEDGRWRCSVETERGQVIGRETFTIDSTKEPDELVTDLR